MEVLVVKLPIAHAEIPSVSRLRPLPLPARLSLGGFALIIRADDASDQGMAHDVALLEADDADALDAFQGVQRVAQAGADTVREVHLAEVAGDDHAGALAHPGQE